MQEEIVVRNLVREWILAEEKEIKDVAADAASDAESVEGNLDTAISSIEDLVNKDGKTLKKMAENRAVRRRKIHEKKGEKRLDEFDPVTLGLGLVASAPMIIRVLGFFLKGALKIYAILAKKLGKVGAAEDAHKRAEIVDEWASHTYHWLHEKYISFYELIVKATIYAAVAYIGTAQDAGAIKEDYAGKIGAWMDSPQGKKAIHVAAIAMDVATSSVLGAMAGDAAVSAFRHTSLALGGLEGSLAAMKAAHVGEAITNALRVALRGLIEAMGEASLSAALFKQSQESLKKIWEEIGGKFEDYGSAAKKMVAAAGIAAAVASSTPTEKSDSGTDSTVQTDA